MLFLCYDVTAEAKGISGAGVIAHKGHRVPFYFKKVAKETILFKHTICSY